MVKRLCGVLDFAKAKVPRLFARRASTTTSITAISAIRAWNSRGSRPSNVFLSKRSLFLSSARPAVGPQNKDGLLDVEEGKQHSWQARRGWSWANAAFAAGCGALAFGLTSQGPTSSEALPGGSGKDSKTALSVEQVRKQVTERLRSVSPAMPEILLPWSVEAEGKGMKMKISVTPDSDLFCLLLTSVLQLTPPEAGGKHRQNEPRSLVGAVRIWDDEKTSTGISVSMASGNLAVSLPWVGSATPELTVTSASGTRGFTNDDIESLAKIIISANTSSRPSTASVDPLFDFFFSGTGLAPGGFRQPQAHDVIGMMRNNQDGQAAEGKHADAVSRLRALGVTVYETGKEGAEKGGGELPWDYLAGLDHVKQEVEDTVMLPLNNPGAFASVVKGTRGDAAARNVGVKAVLFEGPPGCGKTSMGRMMASRAGVPLLYVPLEAVVSKWYGEGEKNLSQVFKLAEEVGEGKGVLLFLDEVEALGMSRDKGDMHEASRRLLSVLLRCIDGFLSSEKVIVVGATNRVMDIDSALRSRFDLSVRFALPDDAQRAAIFALYTRHLTQSDRNKLASIAEGFSGRNIKEVCEAAERKCASRIVRGDSRPGSLPLYSDYADAVKGRLFSGLQ